MDLLPRLEAIVSHAKRLGVNARALSLKAGLSHGYLGTTLSRLRKGEDVNIGHQRLEALIAAAGLPPGWVPPPPVKASAVERDPYRTRAALIIRRRAIAARARKEAREDIFAILMLEHEHEVDPGAAYWDRRYDEEEAESDRVASAHKS